MEVIFDTFFPDSVPENAIADHRPNAAPEFVTIPNGPSLYSDTMLQTAFKSFGSYKAAGTDEIKPILFLHLDWFSRRRLAYIMEASSKLTECWGDFNSK